MKIFLISGLILSFLVSCAPQPKATSVTKTKAQTVSPRSTLSMGLQMEELTLEDYVELNRNVDDLLERVGVMDGKGYLIPRRGGHGYISPELVVYWYTESPAIADLKTLNSRFTTECENYLSRLREERKANQSPEPTSGLAPGRGSP